MRLRSFGSLVTLAIVVVWLAPVFLFGQSRAAGAKVKPDATKPWTAPHTPDGQPDLQGIWLNNDATPLERPKALEGKPFLTDEEVAELKKRGGSSGQMRIVTRPAGTISFLPCWRILTCTKIRTPPAASRGCERSIT